MAAITLTQLRAKTREKADMPIAGFITDSADSLDQFINEGVQLLHDKLVEAYAADYIEKSAALTYTSGDISLPADFYKLLGLDMNSGSGVITLSPFNRRERNVLKNVSIYGIYGAVPSYKLSSVGGVSGTGALRLLPAPGSGTSLTLYYSPSAPVLVAGTDSVNFPAGWEKYVIAYAASQCLAKEESDTSQMDKLLQQWDAGFRTLVENRDVGAPQHAVDTDFLNDDFFWRLY